jgi:hypothetical protein
VTSNAKSQPGHAFGSAAARTPVRSARTLRSDRWWLPPLTTSAVLGLFLVYTIVRVFMRRWYWVNEYHYLTPLYSPCLSESCGPGSTHFGMPLGHFPFPIPLAILSFGVSAHSNTGQKNLSSR